MIPLDVLGQPSYLAGRSAPLKGRRVHFYTSREKWLAARQRLGLIGGSDVPKILGASIFCSPVEWWDAWRSGRLPAGPQSSAATRGQVLESVMLERLAQSRFCQVFRPGWAFGRPEATHVIVTGKKPWMAASLDGLGLDVHRGWGQIELKSSTDPEPWGESCTISTASAAQGCLPEHCIQQCYWYLEVTGLPWLVLQLVLCAPGANYTSRRYLLLADSAYQAELVEKVAAWHALHIRGRARPPAAE